MQKPNPERQRISRETNRLDIATEYTPDDLRYMADEMERDGIAALEIEVDGYDYNLEFREHRLETLEEAEKRYSQELNAYKKYLKAQKTSKERRKKELIKEAKQLGLKVEE